MWRGKDTRFVGLADSPVGLATFMIDHEARSLELIARSFNGVRHRSHTR
jgi:hypothetical protein